MSAWLRSVGLNILLARTHARKTQAQLGVSPTTVGSLEDGQGGTLASLEKIARALGVHPSTFFGTTPVTAEKESAPIEEDVVVIKTPQQQVIWGVVQQLHGKDLQAFQKLALEFLDAKTSRGGPKHHARRGLQRRG